jgi:P-type Ca2+ transporter type 2C
MLDLPAAQAELTDAQAQARLLADGPNRLPQAPPRSLGRSIFDAATQPMFMLLIATAAVYALLGSLTDAATLLLSVFGVGAIAVYQQRRTEHVLASLKELASPRSLVRRQGRTLRIASQDLVQGDCLLLNEGDRLACDARLQRAQSLHLDESLLSGESVPVWKAVGDTVYAGTLVVQGDGTAQVVATGARTSLGRMGAGLSQITPPTSRAQAELSRLAKAVAGFALCICVLAATVYALRQGSWVQGLLVGLTLAMALIPEEFAVVWTVMMALGAWRLTQQQVLTRQPQAIEALGTTSVLCVDKTGTLTRNQMSLVALAPTSTATATSTSTSTSTPAPAPAPAPDTEPPVSITQLTSTEPAPSACHALLRAARWAGIEHGIEPMDRAIRELHARSLADEQAPPQALVQRDGVAAGHAYLCNWWRSAKTPAGTGHVVVKGAPEAVQSLCRLTAAEQTAWAAQSAQVTARGLRVLAVAQGTWDATQPVPTQPPPLQWLGLLGFLDPLREDVPAAMAQCRAAHIRVVMITGDAPLTALAVARSAGLVPVHASVASGVVSGPVFDALSDKELDDALARVSVFARMAPEHKLRIVRALQRRGEVVAMTGDGVNDASALRAADIGVAMGQRGSDVAREAAQLVLLDDSFVALVGAVRMGRRIFINLKKSVGYLLAVHVPIVGVSLIPVLFGGPLLLLPLHVVLLELIIDPACSLVFEAQPEPANCMQQPPRPAQVGLLTWRSAARALSAGGVGLLMVLAAQGAAQLAALSAPACRLVALTSVIVANVALLIWFRADRSAKTPQRSAPALPRPAANRVFGWLLVGLAAAYGVVLTVAPLTLQFGFPVAAEVRAMGLALMGAALLGGLWCARAAPAATAVAAHAASGKTNA